MTLVMKAIEYPDQLDNLKIAEFNREIEAMLDAGVKIILIDFKNVSFISSSGLHPLVLASRAVKTAGCKLFICSLNAQVRMFFELTGLNQVFETFPNLGDLNTEVPDRISFNSSPVTITPSLQKQS